jgi:Tfp pilus assembly protein PilF
MSRRSTILSARAVKASPTSETNRWVIFGIAAFLTAIVWLVFGQTLQHQFVNYDDEVYIVRNAPVTNGLTVDGIVWAFTHVHSSNWHPLTWISHMLDCQISGLNPTSHHFTNVLLHIATTILLFLTLRQMTGALWRSAFVAAVFAIHPLRVESVAWAAERKDLLSGLFFVLTLAAYARYARAPESPRRYALVFVLLALGLMCKSMLVTTPFVLLLLDHWPLNRLTKPARRRLILEKIPLFGLALASGLITIFAQRASLQSATRMPFALRLNNAAISYTDYLRQMFWPRDLAVLYPWDAARLGILSTSLAVLVLVAISVAVFTLRRGQPYLLTGWFWYLVMLMPVIGILQVGNQSRADRYTYLPQIGLYVMVTWGIAELCSRSRVARPILAVLCSVVLMSLGVVAHAQVAYWRKSETLWSHSLACTTDNTDAEGFLAEAYHAEGKTREAMVHFERALQIEPRQAPVHSNLGVFYLELGNMGESLAHLEKALEIEPNFGDAHYNLGNTYLKMGRTADSLIHYKKAVELNPNDTEAMNNMAWILATSPDPLTRDGSMAVEIAMRADRLTRSKSQITSATLAAAYAEAGRFPEAIEAAQRALQLATSEGNTSRVNSIRAQLQLYQSGAAFRDRRN